MSLKELFIRLGKRKPKYKLVKIPADAPACWEERWDRDMVMVSDPEGTCTVRLYGPFAKEEPQSKMLASVNFTEYNMHSAVYTSPDFGGWFLDYAHFDSDAPDALAGAYVLVWSFFINGVWYIDHVFCANKGEYAWKLECVIPAKDLTRGSELCELPLYVFSTLCPNVPTKREGLT